MFDSRKSSTRNPVSARSCYLHTHSSHSIHLDSLCSETSRGSIEANRLLCEVSIRSPCVNSINKALVLGRGISESYLYSARVRIKTFSADRMDPDYRSGCDFFNHSIISSSSLFCIIYTNNTHSIECFCRFHILVTIQITEFPICDDSLIPQYIS